MKRENVIFIISVLLTIASVLYFIFYIKNNLLTIPEIKLNIFNISFIAFLILLYVLGIIIAAFAWNILLKQHNYCLPILDAIAVYCKAQFAKYLPGNVGHHVGRVLLAKQLKIPVHVTIQTMVIEIAWFVSIAAALSIVVLYSLAPDVLSVHLPQIKIELVLGVFAGSVFIPVMIIKILNFYFSNKIEKITGTPVLKLPKPLDGFYILIMQLFCFVIVGIIINLLALYLFGVKDSQIAYLSSVYALAWLAGFIMPGAPAGVGVREVMMVAMLEPLYGAGIAISISIMMRIISTLGDVLAFIIGLASGAIASNRNCNIKNE